MTDIFDAGVVNSMPPWVMDALAGVDPDASTPTPVPRAADLPVGSVVKGRHARWEKFRQATDRDASAWESEPGDRWPDRYIDKRIADGAKVLRVGNDKEET